MPKKVLFIIPSFRIGGTVVSTKNLMILLKQRSFDCWVLPLKPYGELKALYDDEQIVETPFAVKSLIGSKWNEKDTLLNRIRAIWFRLIRSVSSTWADHLMGGAITKSIQPYHFDTIVAGQESTTTRLVAYVRHTNKVAWVRSDYTRTFDRLKKKESSYRSYKAIVCVAEEITKRFKAIYTEYASKTYCIPNPQAGEFFKVRAAVRVEESRFKNDKFTIISVGRLDPIKRFDMIAHIAKELVERGIGFHWYLLG